MHSSDRMPLLTPLPLGTSLNFETRHLYRLLKINGLLLSAILTSLFAGTSDSKFTSLISRSLNFMNLRRTRLTAEQESDVRKTQWDMRTSILSPT
ncbi:hypothetical protein WAI453_010190 [Rhynchosporium graminicola]